jgi:voltage-gated sodium channel
MVANDADILKYPPKQQGDHMGMPVVITRSDTLRLLNAPFVTTGIGIAIVLNAAIIGLETYPALLAQWSVAVGFPLSALLDRISIGIVVLFTLEIAMRCWAQGREYPRDPWNLFDVAVLGVTILGEAPYFSALRVLRVLRLLMLVSRSGRLRLMVSVIIRAFSGCAAIMLLILIILYVFAVVGYALYGASNPDLFGNLHVAMYTLFSVAAAYNLDPVMTAVAPYHPGIYWFLLPYFLLMSFVILNLFTGIIVFVLYELSFDEIQSGRRQDASEVGQPSMGPMGDASTLAGELQAIRKEVALLRGEISRRAP